MSCPNGADLPVEELVVVRVDDEINQALTGCGGRSYQSPPQPREQALALVQVLLGHTGEQLAGAEQWSCAVAGGRRIVRLDPAARPPEAT